MRIESILNYLNNLQIPYTFHGDSNAEINGFCPLKELKPSSMTWVRTMSDEVRQNLEEMPSLLVFCPVGSHVSKCHTIETENPHGAYFRVLQHFFTVPETTGISPFAVIQAKKIGSDFSCGAFSTIGPDVVIGNHVQIGDHVSIEGPVTIGDNTIFDAGCRIGVRGFGHYLNDDGSSTLIPHLGSVEIGKRCFFGANTVVARGTLGATKIADDVHVDALCYLTHNCTVGSRTIITGGSGVAGSATVGADCWLSPRSVINCGVHVGDGAFIGMGSIVTTDVPPGAYATGSPAVVRGPNRDKKYKI